MEQVTGRHFKEKGITRGPNPPRPKQSGQQTTPVRHAPTHPPQRRRHPRGAPRPRRLAEPEHVDVGGDANKNPIEHEGSGGLPRTDAIGQRLRLNEGDDRKHNADDDGEAKETKDSEPERGFGYGVRDGHGGGVASVGENFFDVDVFRPRKITIRDRRAPPRHTLGRIAKAVAGDVHGRGIGRVGLRDHRRGHVRVHPGHARDGGGDVRGWLAHVLHYSITGGACTTLCQLEGIYAWRNQRRRGRTRYPVIPTGTAILPIN